ncbi:hypothetical protein AB0K49_25445 [Streptomyces decoyicus]|uniref:hypothetical protein n=1 Tax=Streptomyces decoyicus TaxID=249567 RepID=UPI00345C6CEA
MVWLSVNKVSNAHCADGQDTGKLEGAIRRQGVWKAAFQERGLEDQYQPFQYPSPPLGPAWCASARGTQNQKASNRIKAAGLATFEEKDTSWCYALQDMGWVRGPGREPWEVYVVKADADQMGKSPALEGRDTCCTSAPEESGEPAPAAAAWGCGC